MIEPCPLSGLVVDVGIDTAKIIITSAVDAHQRAAGARHIIDIINHNKNEGKQCQKQQ